MIRRSNGPAVVENDMTPMIDVVFLLLVFFVLASIGQEPESLLPAELGKGNTETQAELPEPEDFPSQTVRIRLALTENRNLLIEMNEQPVSTPRDLTQRLQTLAELDPGTRIILNVEDSVSVQQFIGIYDLCQLLPFESISLAVGSN